MSAYAMITGKLHGEPVTRQTRNGGQFVAFKLRVANGNTVEWWSVTTFSETAREELDGLGEGDAISAVGALGVETYEKNGETRIALRLTADRILTLKPKPKTAKAKADKPPRASSASAAEPRPGRDIASKSWAAPASAEVETPRGSAPVMDDGIPFFS
jgi:single-stranded DNA-binding protein